MTLLVTILIVVAAIATVLIIYLVQRSVRANKLRISAGREDLVGRTAIAETPLNPKGVVLVEGERWAAILDKGALEPEEEVIITKVDGLRLRVTKRIKEANE